jgi:hypothetical protein
MGEHRVKIAYHEAGHAVAAVALGFDVEVASIVPDDDCILGHVIVPVSDDRDLEYWIRRATMLWCGPLAAQRHPGTFLDDDGGGDDHQSIAVYGDCAAIGSGESDGFKVWTRARAMSILNANWSAVAAVALALLEHDTLTGGEIRQLVAEVEPAPVISIRSAVRLASEDLAASVAGPVRRLTAAEKRRLSHDDLAIERSFGNAT